MDVPEGLRYSKDHEWARLEDGRVRMGITDYAQDALGDVVFVRLPELGEEVGAGSAVSEVESTKSVSDVYAPVTGVVVERNEALADNPQLVNEDPYGAGWMISVDAADGENLDALLDAQAYRRLTETESGSQS